MLFSSCLRPPRCSKHTIWGGGVRVTHAVLEPHAGFHPRQNDRLRWCCWKEESVFQQHFKLKSAESRTRSKHALMSDIEWSEAPVYDLFFLKLYFHTICVFSYHLFDTLAHLTLVTSEESAVSYFLFCPFTFHFNHL